METICITGCRRSQQELFTKKNGLTDKVTEYVNLMILPEIIPETVAQLFKTKPSNIIRILKSLEKKALVEKSGETWLKK